MNLLLVILGAAIGAPLRFAVDQYIRKFTTKPYGIFTVNILGSLFLGLTYGKSEHVHDLFAVGFAGALTTYLWVALLFGLLNATLGSLLKLLTLPAVILTLGLFLVVVNASMLMLVARWSDKLEVENFWAAIFAAVIISVVTRLVSTVGKKALPL
jgi:uncharacterized membrane protein YvlD (DUF360 family)